MASLRNFLTRLAIRIDLVETTRDARRLMAIYGKALLQGKLRETIYGMAETWNKHAAETDTWVDAATLARGEGGPFDSCDLRHWLALAERAGVAAVPARVILELTEEETGRTSGTLRMPGSAMFKGKLESAMQKIADEIGADEAEQDQASDAPKSTISNADLVERLFAAMDDVPEGWMVRHVRCGSEVIKTWAGTGLAGPVAPDETFSDKSQMGPGWIRMGNRRRVDTQDRRIVTATAHGPDGKGATFVARPWIAASRWMVNDDIHRAGSPVAGPGRWPCEWRCFIEDGIVIGVASYYGWASTGASPEDARQALRCAELAQRVANEAVRQGALPRYAEVEFARTHPDFTVKLERVARNKVGFTLDFIETKDGPLMLEGGPPVTAVGGAHPCTFAGAGGKPTYGNIPDVHGVALQMIEGVNMADYSTWNDGPRTNRIFTWLEAQELAKTEAASLQEPASA